MTRWDVCNEALRRAGVSRFLEIGVGRGRAGAQIQADVILGVDPVLSGKERGYTTLAQMRSDDFFALQTASLHLGAVLIDGFHEANQVLRDVEHSLNHLAPHGTIVVHDCNPPDEVSQQVPRPTGQVHWNGDCWKAIVQLRATRRDLQVRTLDADEGLGLITRAPALQRCLEVSEPTWAGLVAHRAEWLGLVASW